MGKGMGLVEMELRADVVTLTRNLFHEYLLKHHRCQKPVKTSSPCALAHLAGVTETHTFTGEQT